MVSADVIISAIGDAFVAIAAAAALKALRYAGQSAHAAEHAVAEAERSRVAAEQERRRDRLIRVGELVEQLAPFAWRQGRSPEDQYLAEWARGTTLLRQALVGFGQDELPRCHRLAREVGREVGERSATGDARNEVRDALCSLG